MKCKFCGQMTKTTVCSYCGYDNVYGDAFDDLSSHSHSSQGPYAYAAKPTTQQTTKKIQPQQTVTKQNVSEQTVATQQHTPEQKTTTQTKDYFNLPLFIILLCLNANIGLLYFVFTKIIFKPNHT